MDFTVTLNLFESAELTDLFEIKSAKDERIEYNQACCCCPPTRYHRGSDLE